MDLLYRFQQHWEQNFAAFNQPGQKFILALSGGLDSTVLAHLLHLSGIEFVAAHVNYQLRASESDRDEQFVFDLCKAYQIPLLIKKVDTQQYLNIHQLSIQEAARKIRYDWFNEIRQQDTAFKNSWVLTAHHANDSIETSVMQFFRGTGIEGLTGITAIHQTNKILRPLLPFYRTALADFANSHSISFVEDSSNSKNIYTRNFIRNSLLPQLTPVFPNVYENILQNIHRFEEVSFLYQEAVDIHLQKLIVVKDNEIHIPILKWKKAHPLHTITWEIIKKFGFNTAQITEVIKLLDAVNSSYIQSSTHRIIKNRQWMIITELAAESPKHILIEAPGKFSCSVGEIILSIHSFNNVLTELKTLENQDKSSLVEWLDTSAIQFPLLLRPWVAGDYFYPLGMNKKKKIAKFLIDARLSKTDKENIWVLESNKKILAIIGHRIDNRFKYGADSQQLLKLVFKPL